MRSDIEKKSFLFSVRIIKMSRCLQEEKKEYILTKQLIRSGTSIGANVVESQQTQSRADFVSNLSIALKEAVETNYWIRLLHASGYITEAEYLSIVADCRELEKMLTSIIKTSRTTIKKSP